MMLERGVTHDPEFEKWAGKVWDLAGGLGREVSLQDFRKDITMEVYNEAGQLALSVPGLPLLGVGVSKRRRSWTRTRTRWRSSTSSSRTRGGNATSPFQSRWNQVSRSRPRRGTLNVDFFGNSQCGCGAS